MSEILGETIERRGGPNNDRRKHSRNGRRTEDPDPKVKWRRLAWLFAAYAGYLSLRSLPATIKGLFVRRREPS